MEENARIAYETQLPDAYQYGAQRSSVDKQLIKYYGPMLDCITMAPTYAAGVPSMGTSLQDVVISGKWDGTLLPRATVLWMPEKGYDSVFLLVPRVQGTVWGSVGTPINPANPVSSTNVIQSFAVQRNTQIFVGAQRSFVKIQPELPRNYALGRAVCGAVTMFSNTQSTTNATLNGSMVAGNLSDYRDVDMAAGAEMAVLTSTQKDGISSARLADGIVLIQGPDHLTDLQGVSERNTMHTTNNGYVVLANQLTQPNTGAPSRFWCSDGTYLPTPTGSNAVDLVQLRYDPPIGEFPEIRMTVDLTTNNMPFPTLANNPLQMNPAQTPTFQTVQQVTDCVWVKFSDYYIQSQGNETLSDVIFWVDSTVGPCTTSVDNTAPFPDFTVQVHEARHTVYNPYHAARRYRADGVHVWPPGASVVAVEGAMSTYMGTLITPIASAVSNPNPNSIIQIQDVALEFLAEYKPGTIGPARVMSYANADNQQIILDGKVFWQVVASNNAAALVKASQLTKGALYNLRSNFDHRLWDGDSTIFRRIYTRSGWAVCVKEFIDNPSQALQFGLKVTPEQVQLIANNLSADATGFFAELGTKAGDFFGGKFGDKGAQIGSFVGRRAGQLLDHHFGGQACGTTGGYAQGTTGAYAAGTTGAYAAGTTGQYYVPPTALAAGTTGAYVEDEGYASGRKRVRSGKR